jgi:hypothetical protein
MQNFYHEDGTEQAKDGTHWLCACKPFPAGGGFKAGLSD